MSWGVNAGYNWGSSGNVADIIRRGDNAGLSGGGPLNTLLFQGLNDYFNSGALTDMIKGGAGFGQSRRYRQYNPYDEQYGYLDRRQGGVGGGGGGGGTGGATNTPEGTEPVNPDPYGNDPGWDYGPGGKPPMGGNMTGKASAQGAPGMSQSVAPGQEESVTNVKGREVDPRRLGPGQQPTDWYDPNDPYGENQYNDPLVGQGHHTGGNQYWGQNDDAPVEGQGLIGEILGYGRNPTAIDQRLTKDLGWQAGGDLMDLENQELGAWKKFGQRNNTEKNIEDQLGWWQKGELTDLEQQEKHGFKDFANATDLENEVGNSWRGVAGPGQYDPLRGDTLTSMVGSKGYSPTERGAMMGSSLLPIQQALEAQKLEGDARQAATGNAAGRWGASNAMALNAAGQASQAGREIEMGSAQQARQDRAQGLEGLGGLQGQIDARKVQGAQGLAGLSGQQRDAGALSLQGLSNLAGKQRDSQKFGMNTGLALNDQMRGAQAMSAQGIGGLGQRQRANTQWGLEALSGQNQNQKNDRLTGIGLTNDFMNKERDFGMQGANLAAGIGSLEAGTSDKAKSSGGSVGVSV
jgi:hypothetical protein